ncbi:hypothetical protein IAQ61_007937 [Plenodomus lingam]|uniref:Phosphoglycerate mutase n=1 Tax=Leptosphaeria maculans (strain JN3 / isolate v23.1.3 / race Av1-4-5-6-7-8) TaxID=985895 RepID=E4ZZK7_LEPMJ|nr:hypothetical protein LEMA_P102540.1 [Plenodomus lingam JN3]KAH9867345.1 hypothetical protein IAQ61_007937 [Plenodomus lingam]CBX97123.1 hypothetical protein LEMA_P102540.1 [Plenodomus lingam JN3]
MPPTLILIRHAQAEHNVSSDWSIRDAPLTELGKQQCLELQESLRNSEIGNQVERIVVSAQRRTLQTATIGLDWLIKKGVPVVPSALWQENADKPCDTGSPLDVISSEFPQYDFSHVDPSFPDKTTKISSNPYAFTQRAILARGQSALRELYSRPEKVIAVVSHSGFLRTAVANRMFFNADWRVFTFDEDEGARQGKLVLKESEETEKKGGGMGRSNIGVFGVVEGDFPAEEEERVEEVGEASKEVPSQ